MELHTPRILLRPLQPGDAEVLFRIYQGKDVLRYFPNPNPPALEKVQRFVAAQQKHWERFGYGNWAILPIREDLVPAGEQDIIGWAGLQYLPELEETEVGFLLDRSAWGKGYATEAARAALAFGFERCQLDHIIALVHAENAASRRVIEKCGLRYVDCLHLWGVDLLRYRIN